MQRKDREIKEFDEIIDVFSRSKVLHLALISNGKPYAVPVNLYLRNVGLLSIFSGTSYSRI